MISRLTLSVLSTGVLAGGATVEVVAGAVQRTLAIIDTLASLAPEKWVPSESCWTCAHRSVCSGPVKPGLTRGTRTTWVGVAQVLLLERSTAHEWVASEAFRTGADSLVVGRLAVGLLATHVRVRLEAGIAALETDAVLVRGAVVVAGTLCVTPAEGVAQEVGGAGAGGAVVDSLAVGVLPAHSLLAGGDTAVGLAVALLRLATGMVGVALVTTTGQRVADVGRLTSADGSVVGTDLAVGVRTTRGADLCTCESATVSQWISCCSFRTPANGHVALYCTVGSLTTRDGTGVDTFVVFTGTLRTAVGVLVTLSLDTACVGVALMSRKTFTDGSSTNITTLSPGTTNTRDTRVGPTPRPAVRTADIASSTGAHSSRSASSTVSIGPTQVTGTGVGPAGDVRISDMLRRAFANSGTPVVLTNGILSTRILTARVKLTVGVGVSCVAWSTLAAGNSAVGRAVGIGGAGAGGAGLETAGDERVSCVAGPASADRSLS